MARTEKIALQVFDDHTWELRVGTKTATGTVPLGMSLEEFAETFEREIQQQYGNAIRTDAAGVN